MQVTILSTLLLALAGLAPAAPLADRGSGTAAVVNQCPYAVHLRSASADGAGPTTTLTPGNTYREGLRSVASGGGVSIKIGTDADLGGEVEQFEYRVDSRLWYDLSEIDGHPFAGQSVHLRPSGAATGGACVDVDSKAAYQRPDDVATKSCDLGTSLTLTLCG